MTTTIEELRQKYGTGQHPPTLITEDDNFVRLRSKIQSLRGVQELFLGPLAEQNKVDSRRVRSADQKP